MIAKLVYFSGSVQGVGFRYTATSIARKFDVTGYVANLSDGQVEMLVEGTAQEVNDFIDQVREEMNSYISRVEIKDTPTTGPPKADQQFSIRYY